MWRFLVHKKKIRLFLSIIAVYISIVGTVSFSCFIIEEALQIITFSNFSIKQSRRYDLLKKNLEKMESMNDTLRVITEYFLWINPFGYISYLLYVDATDTYIATLMAEAMANDPDLFIDEVVSVRLSWTRAIPVSTGYLVKAGLFDLLIAKKPEVRKITVQGHLRKQENGRYLIVL